MVEFEPFHSAVNRIPVLRDKAQEKGYSPDLLSTKIGRASCRERV